MTHKLLVVKVRCKNLQHNSIISQEHFCLMTFSIRGPGLPWASWVKIWPYDVAVHTWNISTSKKFIRRKLHVPEFDIKNLFVFHMKNLADGSRNFRSFERNNIGDIQWFWHFMGLHQPVEWDYMISIEQFSDTYIEK